MSIRRITLYSKRERERERELKKDWSCTSKHTDCMKIQQFLCVAVDFKMLLYPLKPLSLCQDFLIVLEFNIK